MTSDSMDTGNVTVLTKSEQERGGPMARIQLTPSGLRLALSLLAASLRGCGDASLRRLVREVSGSPRLKAT